MKAILTRCILVLAVGVLPVVGQTPSATPAKPLERAQILALLAGDVPSSRVAMLVQQRGTSFTPNDAFLDQIRKGGGEDDLVDALKSAHVANATTAPPLSAGTQPAPTNSVASSKADEAKDEELAQHVAKGAELFQQRHYAEAEAEYRAAIKIDPEDSNFHMALSRALNSQKKTDEGMKEARLAIRLDQQSDMAHFSLGNSLRVQQDYAGAAAEYRQAIRLNPNYAMTHNNLGVALRDQGDLGGAIAEFRKALEINPHEQLALANLGNALEHQGDLDGAITQYQELARLRPRMAVAHFRLGQLLEKKGESRRALRQFHDAAELAPDNRQFREAYERAQRNQ